MSLVVNFLLHVYIHNVDRYRHIMVFDLSIFLILPNSASNIFFKFAFPLLPRHKAKSFQYVPPGMYVCMYDMQP